MLTRDATTSSPLSRPDPSPLHQDRTRRSTACPTTSASRTRGRPRPARRRAVVGRPPREHEPRAVFSRPASRIGSTISPSCSPTALRVPRFGDRALLDVGRRRGTSSRAPPAPRPARASPFDLLGRARSTRRRVVPLRRPEGRSRRPDAPARGAPRHLGSRDLCPELVDAATFEHMRAGADRIAPDTTHAIWEDDQRSSTGA